MTSQRSRGHRAATLLAATVAALLGLAAALIAAPPASALEVTVDSFADASDALPGNGACATPGGACTLRAAFEELDLHDDPADRDSIALPAGTYVLTRDTGFFDHLAWGAHLRNDELTLTGAGAATTTIEQTVAEERVIQSAEPLRLSGLTVTGGDALAGGGGISHLGGDLSLTGVSVTGNVDRGTAGGGGVRFSPFAHLGGALTITHSTISGNATSGVSGGGLQSQGPTTITGSRIVDNTSGGGIHFLADPAAHANDLQITGSTIAGNQKPGGEGGGVRFRGNDFTLSRSTVSGNSADRGGGLSLSDGSTVVTNSTISANAATLTGGGIQRGAGGMVRTPQVLLRHVTLAGNAAPAGAGIESVGGGAARFEATIFAGNDCRSLVGGMLDSLDFNLETGDTCFLDQAHDQPATNPRLGPLQDNGGPTRTRLPGPSSPAIDRAIAAGLGADQRGLRRPSDFGSIANVPAGDGSDIGAAELQAPPPPSPSPSPSPPGGPPPPTGGGAPPPPAALPDTKAPKLEVTAKKRARLRRKVKIRVRCDEPCRVIATGKAVARAAKRGRGAAHERPAKAKRETFKLKRDRATLRAGRRERLKLRFAKPDFKNAKRAAKREARLSARIKVEGTDAAGNRVTEKVRIRLR
ncbi:MAG: hypothetical protein GEU88_02130 [Solirubrobacterales bacterium]|nr:hypothetical protein [Solirubrobacterales bacterium]